MRSMWKKKWFENGCRTLAFKYIIIFHGLPGPSKKQYKVASGWSNLFFLWNGLNGVLFSEVFVLSFMDKKLDTFYV